MNLKLDELNLPINTKSLKYFYMSSLGSFMLSVNSTEIMLVTALFCNLQIPGINPFLVLWKQHGLLLLIT